MNYIGNNFFLPFSFQKTNNYEDLIEMSLNISHISNFESFVLEDFKPNFLKNSCIIEEYPIKEKINSVIISSIRQNTLGYDILQQEKLKNNERKGLLLSYVQKLDSNSSKQICFETQICFENKKDIVLEDEKFPKFEDRKSNKSFQKKSQNRVNSCLYKNKKINKNVRTGMYGKSFHNISNRK